MRFLAFVCGVCVAFLPVVAAASPNDADSRTDEIAMVPSELVAETQNENERTVEVPAGAEKAGGTKAISFIDSPTATCYQPDRRVDECFINWYYLSVSAGTPNYMHFMSLTLNATGGIGLYYGFFQESMYVPYNMHDRGFRVKCGPLVPSADPSVPDHGNSYGYTIRARNTEGLVAANYGTVFCPAFIP